MSHAGVVGLNHGMSEQSGKGREEAGDSECVRGYRAKQQRNKSRHRVLNMRGKRCLRLCSGFWRKIWVIWNQGISMGVARLT